MQDDDYELMPATELQYLRKEVEKLKRNPLGDTQASISLLDSLTKLNANVQRLNDIFTGANDDMVKQFNEHSFQEQLHRLAEQQEKLAKGIVAVAELVKEVQKKQGTLPDIDQLSQARNEPQHLALNAQALSADLQNAPQRNPFADGPPRSADLPPMPMMQAPVQQRAPGFMLNAGIDIPDMDVPPPPPRR